MQCELAKKGRFGDGGSAASPMIKSAKNTEREKRIGAVRIASLHLVRDIPNL